MSFMTCVPRKLYLGYKIKNKLTDVLRNIVGVKRNA
jgi:hypothetical protein